MNEEINIKEAEIIIENEAENKDKAKQENPHVEKFLILILGILIGITLKTEAIKRITIGFDDYLMKYYEQSYDLNKMQDEQIQKMIEEQEVQESEMEN